MTSWLEHVLSGGQTKREILNTPLAMTEEKLKEAISGLMDFAMNAPNGKVREVGDMMVFDLKGIEVEASLPAGGRSVINLGDYKITVERVG